MFITGLHFPAADLFIVARVAVENDWPGCYKPRVIRILEAQFGARALVPLLSRWANDGEFGADVARVKLMEEAGQILRSICCYPVSQLIEFLERGTCCHIFLPCSDPR